MLAALSTVLLSALGAAAPATPPTAANAPASECPSSAQLGAALNTLVAGIAAPATTATPLSLAGGLRLEVTSSSEGEVRVDLVDVHGEIVLHRALPAPPRGSAPDCAALADTIALIVDRYLHDVGYEAPSLPPPALKPPPTPAPAVTLQPTGVAVAPSSVPRARGVWRLGLAGSARRGDAGGIDGDGDLTIGVESAGEGVHRGARLSLGYAPPVDARWSSATATLRRLPFRLGVYLSLAAGPGRLEPGVGAGADLLLVSAEGANAAPGAHLAPEGDLALGYAVFLARPLYLRLLLRAALTVPYAFKTSTGAQVWGTPRFYGDGGVELGLAFR
ncbi:MAG TPA: hypothetical protein VG319_06840 [Polyangia bacterium]|nr:hypothetical protein [Polyangia bacterium]